MANSEPHVGDWIVLYGSLMRGLDSMGTLGIGDRLRFVGPCIAPGELFDLGRYPGVRPGDGLIVAELYALLDIEVIPILDDFEGYRSTEPRESLYLRETIALKSPSDTHAWIYIYNRIPDASTRIVSGDWRAHLNERASG